MLRTLPRKITVLSLILAVLFLASWQYWVYTGASDTLRQQKTNDMRLLLDRTGDYLGLYAEGLSGALLNLADALAVIGEDAGQLEQALNAFRASNPGKVLSATLMVTPERVYSTKQAAYDVFGSTPLLAIYREVNESKFRGIQWTEPYTSSLALADTVALYKPVSLPGATAVLIIEVNLHTMLSQLLRVDRASSVSWTVVSSGGAIVSTSSDDASLFPGGTAQLSRAELNQMMPSLLESAAGADTVTHGGEEYIVMDKSAICFGWRLFALIRSGDLYAPVTSMVQSTSLLGVAHLLILTVCIVLLCQGVTRPLSAMAKQLQQAKDPLALSFAPYVRRKDEAGVLARSLTVMIANTNALAKRQESLLAEQHRLELVMLQGQIHPHFLGNTLACIGSLAKEKAYEAVQESLMALTRLMNYSIARTDAMVTLREEMACIDAYIALRQIRAKVPFRYQAFVAAQHMQHRVPRLFLQPVIENAIVHGLSLSEQEGAITVTSYEQHGKLYLCVENDGPTCSAEHMEEVTRGEVAPSPHAHGIGVNNVFQRLRLACAGSGGGRLEPREHGGARVTLDLGNH